MTTPSDDGVPILMYHQVSETPHPNFVKYTVTKRAFSAQMKWLAAAGYTTVDLPTLLAHRRDGIPLPKQVVVVTFDDGFRDCAEIAAPVMTAHGFTATFFLVAGLMGGSSRWLAAERGIELALMSWEDARTLEAAGHHCESHSMTHPRLSQLPLSTCRDELARSRATIEDALGHSVRCLAYPFGAENQQVRDLAADCGYEAACVVTIGLSTRSDDMFALRRVPVLGTDSLLDFISRVRTGFTVRDRLSALARSVIGTSSSRGDV